MNSPRTIWFDGDFRKDPKTEIYCCICQKDLKGKFHKALLSWEEDSSLLHPEDADPTTGYTDVYVGLTCAKKNKIPVEFFLPQS